MSSDIAVRAVGLTRFYGAYRGIEGIRLAAARGTFPPVTVLSGR
ncbi:hypothetical protein ACPPVO_17415 [Dactylosporangium sp. McL0621]